MQAEGTGFEPQHHRHIYIEIHSDTDTLRDTQQKISYSYSSDDVV